MKKLLSIISYFVLQSNAQLEFLKGDCSVRGLAPNWSSDITFGSTHDDIISCNYNACIEDDCCKFNHYDCPSYTPGVKWYSLDYFDEFVFEVHRSYSNLLSNLFDNKDNAVNRLRRESGDTLPAIFDIHPKKMAVNSKTRFFIHGENLKNNIEFGFVPHADVEIFFISKSNNKEFVCNVEDLDFYWNAEIIQCYANLPQDNYSVHVRFLQKDAITKKCIKDLNEASGHTYGYYCYTNECAISVGHVEYNPYVRTIGTNAVSGIKSSSKWTDWQNNADDDGNHPIKDFFASAASCKFPSRIEARTVEDGIPIEKIPEMNNIKHYDVFHGLIFDNSIENVHADTEIETRYLCDEDVVDIYGYFLDQQSPRFRSESQFGGGTLHTPKFLDKNGGTVGHCVATGDNAVDTLGDTGNTWFGNIRCIADFPTDFRGEARLSLTSDTHSIVDKPQDGQRTWWDFLYSLSDDMSFAYNIYAHPIIEQVSSHSGPVVGGNQIKISGQKLNSEDVTVKVGFKDCEVDYDQSTDTEIVCNLKRGFEQSCDQTSFPGDAGFSVSIDKSGDSVAYDGFFSSQYYPLVNSSPDVMILEASGWFVAPKTGYYKFKSFTKGHATLSKNDKISYCPANTLDRDHTFISTDRSDSSEKIFLKKGEYLGLNMNLESDEDEGEYATLEAIYYGDDNGIGENFIKDEHYRKYQSQTMTFYKKESAERQVIQNISKDEAEFTLTLCDDTNNCKTSETINFNEDGDKVIGQKIKDMFAVTCGELENFDAFHVENFETDSKYSVPDHISEDSEHAPFCGQSSLFVPAGSQSGKIFTSRTMNPLNPLGSDPLNDSHNPDVCFAYKGILRSLKMPISYKFTTAKPESTTINVEMNLFSSEWKYHCFNLHTLLINDNQVKTLAYENDSAYGTKSLSDMYFERFHIKSISLGDNLNQPIQIDNLVVGRITGQVNAPTRTLGVFSNSGGIKKVQIKKNRNSGVIKYRGNAFEIAIYSNRCGWKVGNFKSNNDKHNTKVAEKHMGSFNGRLSIDDEIYSVSPVETLQTRLNAAIKDASFNIHASCTKLSVTKTHTTGGSFDYEDINDQTVFGIATVFDDRSPEHIYIPRIPGNWLRKSESVPQVTVSIGGSIALCKGDCSYNFQQGPEISSVSLDGNMLEIEGKFLSDANSIIIGGSKITDFLASEDSISARLPENVCSGNFQVYVDIDNFGYASSTSENAISIFIPFTVDYVSAERFGVHGGVATITGNGFCDMDDFAHGFDEAYGSTAWTTSLVDIIDFNTARVSFKSRDSSSRRKRDVDDVEIDPALTPDIDSLDDSALNFYGGDLTITGSNFGSDTNATLSSVTLTDQKDDSETDCVVTSITETEIVCNIENWITNAKHDVEIFLDGRGFGITSKTVQVDFYISAIVPVERSVFQGGTFEVRGNGFMKSLKGRSFWSNICSINKIEHDFMKCKNKNGIDNGQTANTVAALQTDIATGRTHDNFYPSNPSFNRGGVMEWCWKFDKFVNIQISVSKDNTVIWTSETVRAKQSCIGKPFFIEGSYTYTTNDIYDDDDVINMNWKLYGGFTVLVSETDEFKLKMKLNLYEAEKEPTNDPVSPVDECMFAGEQDRGYTYISTTVPEHNVESFSFEVTDETIAVTVESEYFADIPCASTVEIVIINAETGKQAGTTDCTRLDNSVTCHTSKELEPMKFHRVIVSLQGYGIIAFDEDIHPYIFIKPTVTEFTTEINKNGGQSLELAGFGFNANITWLPEDLIVESYDYRSVNIITPDRSSSEDETFTITLFYKYDNKLEKSEYTSTVELTFGDDVTPVFDLEDISLDDEKIVLTGSNLRLSSSMSGKILAADAASEIDAISLVPDFELSTNDQLVLAMPEGLSIGPYFISVFYGENVGRGIENGNLNIQHGEVTSKDGDEYMVSYFGGMELEFITNGLKDIVITLSYDACDQCDITLVDDTVTHTIESYETFSSDVKTKVQTGTAVDTIQGVLMHDYSKVDLLDLNTPEEEFIIYDNVIFKYSAEHTPYVTAVTNTASTVTAQVTNMDCANAHSRLVNTETGMHVNCAASFQCVQSGSDATLTCEIDTTIPAGSYYYCAFSETVGRSNMFEDTLIEKGMTVDSVTPDEGVLGGGITHTVCGDGLSKSSLVEMCGASCVVSSYDSDTGCLVCESTTVDASYNDFSDHDCTVSITQGQITGSFDHVTLVFENSAVIKELTVTQGGSAGGTKIRLRGTGLLEATAISIGGIECTDLRVLESKMICTTGASDESNMKAEPIVILPEGKGRAYNPKGFEFHYVDLWSSTYTWGCNDDSCLPQEGDIVVVEAGHHLVLDQDTPKLKALVIMGGTFEVSRYIDDDEVHLQAEYIVVVQDGHFMIGSEDENYPCDKKVTITLNGNAASIRLPHLGSKVLGVHSGKLDLHGCRKEFTWHLLSETVEAGSDTIKMVQNVDWSVGDEIAIASTAGKNKQAQNEIRTIKSINDNVITLEEALEFRHISVTSTWDTALDEQREIPMRAEVGLLTRNILIQGSKHDDWNNEVEACEGAIDLTIVGANQACFRGRWGKEIETDEFGGQVMCMNVEHCKIAFVEVTHCGQASRLGRYPVHFHLMGNAPTSYAKGLSMHHNFNRAITIHGTHYATVEHCVAYETKGHAYFIEDGMEENNVIQYNLAIKTIPSASLLNADQTPTSFWITNPVNTIRHNHAASNTFSSYWLNLPEHATGPSTDTEYCGQNQLLQEFFNNTAHDSGFYGLWIFPIYLPRLDGECNHKTEEFPTEEQVPQFTDFYAWNCFRGLEVTAGNSQHYRRFIAANNEHAQVSAKTTEGDVTEETSILFQDHVLVGYTDNDEQFTRSMSEGFGIEMPWGKGTFFFYDMAYHNLGMSYALDLCYGSYFLDCVTEFQTKNTLWGEDTTHRTRFEWEHEGVILDMDGTYSETNVPSVVLHESDLVDKTKCDYDDRHTAKRLIIEDDGLGKKNIGIVCKQSDVKLYRVSFNEPIPSSLNGKPVTVGTEFGTSIVNWREHRATHSFGWAFFMLGKAINSIQFETYGSSWTADGTIEFFNEEGDWVMVQPIFGNLAVEDFTGHMEFGYTVNTNLDLKVVGTTIDPDTDPNNAYAINEGENSVVGLFKYNATHEFETYQVQPFIFQVVEPEVTVIDSNVDQSDLAEDCAWSDPTCWPGGELPGKDSIAIIGAGRTVTIDSSIDVGYLVIQGALTVEYGNDIDIRTKGMLITGGNLSGRKKRDTTNAKNDESVARFSVGSRKRPFPCSNTLRIILHDDVVEGLENEANLDVRTIKTDKNLHLIGCQQPITSVMLELDANVDDTTITVDTKISKYWKVGGHIAIAPTGMDPLEAEDRIITNIDKYTITFDKPLKYFHSGMENTESTYLKGTFYRAAEVIYLTRNIIIESDAEAENYQDHLGTGGRLVIKKRGDAKPNVDLRYIQFNKMAHFGDNNKPAIYMKGVKSSRVQGCSFVDSYGPGVGLYGARPSYIKSNVFYNGVGSAIMISNSKMTKVEYNTAIKLRNSNFYLDYVYPEKSQLGNKAFNMDESDVPYGIEILETDRIFLFNNKVGGSEGGAFFVYGESCDKEIEPCSATVYAKISIMSKGNVGHTVGRGVSSIGSAMRDCSKIAGFYIWNAHQMGVYTQSRTDNLIIEDVVIVNAKIGILPMQYTNPARMHDTGEVTFTLKDATIAIESDSLCANFGDDWHTTSNWHYYKDSYPDFPLTGGLTGLLSPLMQLKHNGFPKFQIDICKAQSPINTRSCVGTTEFNNFKQESSTCSLDNRAISTARMWLEHMPSLYILSDVKFNSMGNDIKRRLYLHRPDLTMINLLDCGDMPCDSNRWIIYDDRKGDLTGNRYGAILSQTEYQWEDTETFTDKAWGLGDYRIPKSLLTDDNGERIDAVENKGIARGEDCEWNEDVTAYVCEEANYVELNIESQDEDKDVRRLSPIGIQSETGYIDLLNGPADHTTCLGYACQIRMSSFWGLLACGQTYKVHSTSDWPLLLNLKLNHRERDCYVKVEVFMGVPNRIDVYEGEEIIYPTNTEYDAQGNATYILPTAEHVPSLDNYRVRNAANVHGRNFYESSTETLHVILTQSTQLQVRTIDTIIVKLTVMTEMSLDEFFESDDLALYLASILEVDPSKITTVDIINEKSRRKREVGQGNKYLVTVHIAEPRPKPSKAARLPFFRTGGGYGYAAPVPDIAEPVTVPMNKDVVMFNAKTFSNTFSSYSSSVYGFVITDFITYG